MSDVCGTKNTNGSNQPTLFQSALAERWELLPPQLQALHSVQDTERFSGTARITRGSSFIARLATWFFGFPSAGENVPVTVTKTRIATGEIWERDFDNRIFRSYCTPATLPCRYRERFGPFIYEQELLVKNEAMHLPVRRGWFLGIPLPRFLLPLSESREYAREGIFHFDVALFAPLGGGLVVRYRGKLVPGAGMPKPSA
ncbi:DUF4166 domain-containing protein [Stappia sp. GBMRC 2046]|uniref:DUF4166 domain-containing protein n=1 Tax=Stappia sediminis TaxID=2692190 RepID=A0A7X3S788_9HYPH|nr:DUF4166 domain-containing protein [Stappia sediminis]MXN64517.1 DUF4166 domain-containing protein [Stappia sediminis]